MRLVPAVLLAVFMLLMLPVRAADALKPGVDYLELRPPQPVRVAEGKIEVMEFFNYSCPHCFRLQGHLSKWLAEHAGEDIALVHQPVVFARYNGHFARVYYTLQGLRQEKDLHGKVYEALHVERELINSKGRFLDWLEAQGADYEKAEKVYESFTVKTRAARAETLPGDYGIDSTPQMVINGKYVINTSLSRSYDRMMDTLTALVERERQAQ